MRIRLTSVMNFSVLLCLIVLAVANTEAQRPLSKNRSQQMLAAKEIVVKNTQDKDVLFHMTKDMAILAFKAGDMVKAGFYSKDLLKQAESMKEDWDYGNAVHAANLVLGRVALVSGDIDEAKRLLLEAGKTPGSPQLDSFGPDMLFAKELLEKGEKKTVIQYFDLCARFWRMEDGNLGKWRAQAERNEIPDFGPNVRYIF